MSQCLNEQPGELLLKSPLKKEGKKRESLSPWKQKNTEMNIVTFRGAVYRRSVISSSLSR